MKIDEKQLYTFKKYYKLSIDNDNNSYYKNIDIRLLKLDDKFSIKIKNFNNKLIQTNELITKIITTTNGNIITFDTGKIIEFHSLEETKNYIIKIKKQYKKMKAIIRQLNIDTDFDIDID